MSDIAPFEEKNDERPSTITLTISSRTERMSFQHSTDSEAETVIQVGRRPSSLAWTVQPKQALFRCAVVSRHHAELIITNDGTVYVQDTNSHHGTYIGQSFQIVPPNVRTLVSDGDVLAFGKSVGKDEDQVNPVIVTVSVSRQEEPTHRTGRYGLPTSQSPSPSDDSSMLDDESIPSPTHSLDYGPGDNIHVQATDPFSSCVVWSPIPSFAPFREYLNFKRHTSPSPVPVEEEDHDREEDSSSSSPSRSPSVEIRTQDDAVEEAVQSSYPEIMHHDEPAYPAVEPDHAFEPQPVHVPEHVPEDRQEVQDLQMSFDRDQATSYVVYPPPLHPFQSDNNIQELKSAIASLEEKVKVLDERRRHYRSRFNSNMHNVSRKFVSLNQRVDDVWGSVTLLQSHVKAVLGDDSELEVRLRKLEDKVSDDERLVMLDEALQEALAKVDELVKRQEEADQNKDESAPVEDQMVTEPTKTAEDEAEDQRVVESTRAFLDNEFRRARFTFRSSADELEGHTEPASPLPPSSPTPVEAEAPLAPANESLKRKRVEDDDVIMTSDPQPVPTTIAQVTPPPSKKLRRAGETATAFVLGAVAAWGALAFS